MKKTTIKIFSQKHIFIDIDFKLPADTDFKSRLHFRFRLDFQPKPTVVLEKKHILLQLHHLYTNFNRTNVSSHNHTFTIFRPRLSPQVPVSKSIQHTPNSAPNAENKITSYPRSSVPRYRFIITIDRLNTRITISYQVRARARV